MALFSLATECGSEKQTLAALEQVRELLSENPGYILFLSCPTIPKSERTAALSEAFEDSLPEYVLSFLQILTEKNHAHLIPDCIADYRELYDKAMGILPARVRSARELTKDESDRLKSALEKRFHKSVRLFCDCDPTLLGGMVVEIDGVRMDGSLRHRLSDVKEVMQG